MDGFATTLSAAHTICHPASWRGSGFNCYTIPRASVFALLATPRQVRPGLRKVPPLRAQNSARARQWGTGRRCLMAAMAWQTISCRRQDDIHAGAWTIFRPAVGTIFASRSLQKFRTSESDSPPHLASQRRPRATASAPQAIDRASQRRPRSATRANMSARPNQRRPRERNADKPPRSAPQAYQPREKYTNK